MWSLRKNKQEEVETPEGAPVQPSMWLVWLLSIATFILTVLIVLGLFWAGRWVVRRFTAKTPTPPATVQTQPGISNDRSSANTAAPTSNPSSGTNTAPSSGSSSSSSTSQNQTPTPAPAPTQTTPPATTLVNTGPSSDE